MTPFASVIGIGIAAALAVALLAIFLMSRRADRNGTWQPVRKTAGEPVMGRWTGAAWEHRRMTDDELADYLSRDAW